jgi:DNA polymerase
MSLDLDERQRAMLQEMRVRVWWPMQVPQPEPAHAGNPRAEAPVAAAPAPPSAAAPDACVPAEAATVAKNPSPPARPSSSVHDMDIDRLAATIAACTACNLCEGRKAAVFPSQPLLRQADWLVVGDPPTEEDERAGAAFAGQAGELLDNMLRAVQRTRDGTGAAGAWLTHVVKCRPAVVRNPQADELARCADYLRREVALVQPRVILAMGRFAALSLLVATEPEVANVPFGKLRGRVFAFEGVPVVVTYSPARLLRAQEDKAGAWADLCLAQATATPAPRPHAAGPTIPLE